MDIELLVHTDLSPKMLTKVLGDIYDLRPGHVALWRHFTKQVQSDPNVRRNASGDPTIVFDKDAAKALAAAIGYSTDTVYRAIYGMERAGILLRQIDPKKMSLLKLCPETPKELDSDVLLKFRGRK